MYDAKAPTSLLVVEQLERPLVTKRLLHIARLFTGSEEDAKDLVSNALLRVFDPDDVPWDPKRPFLSHMKFVMRQVWDQQMRKVSVQREVLDGGLAADERAASPRPRQDDDLEHRREIRLWRPMLAQVLAKIGAKHPLVVRMCEVYAQGFDEPDDQAQMIGCDVKEIYRARETLKYHGMVALAEWENAERRRMSALREETAKKKNEAAQ